MWESINGQLARSYGLTPASEIIADIPNAQSKDLVKIATPVERHHYGESIRRCHLEPYYNILRLPKDYKAKLRKLIHRRQQFTEMRRIERLLHNYKTELPNRPKQLDEPCLDSYVHELRIELDKVIAKVQKNGEPLKAIIEIFVAEYTEI